MEKDWENETFFLCHKTQQFDAYRIMETSGFRALSNLRSYLNQPVVGPERKAGYKNKNLPFNFFGITCNEKS